ncbi:hydroxypyruvate reductase [Parvibaculum indicum]|uniref:glycerate kinase type-2 family protein n=1 Tax=Parvibaculum indicum TaxID=562969 RepID=UPI00141D9C0D|nr:DUF4147 domain-containing protein [Parvibaculum indicum]NIJ40533.1 hydroxypyruvate reductase [Parvibaculum indicum]
MRAQNEEWRKQLTALYEAGLREALPAQCLPPCLPAPPERPGRLVIFAIGKAAASMAAAAEDWYEEYWPGTDIHGLALTRYGHTRPTHHVEAIEAAHPVPDEAGLEGSARLLALAESLTPRDQALVLLSGGGSALATLPADGLTLADKQAVTRALFAAGLPITAMNGLRKHLSRIKGGRLAAAIHPAPCVTLAISDVAGDDPSTIASGPTVTDPTTLDDARAILARLEKHMDGETMARLSRALEQAGETPTPGDPAFAEDSYRIVASGNAALKAAAKLARERGYEPLLLGDAVEGEAREVAARHAALALKLRHESVRTAILSGGEVSVTFDTRPEPEARGGPGQEYALALAIALKGEPGIAALAADTDGIDGGSGDENDPAGAFVLPDTLSRAAQTGLDAENRLARHDSGTFFARIGDLLKTGPSFTNVNDFRVILVEPDESLPSRE